MIFIRQGLIRSPCTCPCISTDATRGAIPKHQILNNQASAEYKATIEASGISYELVPPKEHQCNMAEKAIQTFKDSSESSAVAPHPCQSTYGVNFSHRSNGSSSFFDNLGCILTYQRMLMSTNTTITIGIPLSPSAWKHWSTTNHTNTTPTPNTAQKLLSWALPPNTININVETFGTPQHVPHASLGQLFSSANISPTHQSRQRMK